MIFSFSCSFWWNFYRFRCWISYKGRASTGSTSVVGEIVKKTKYKAAEVLLAIDANNYVLFCFCLQ